MVIAISTILAFALGAFISYHSFIRTLEKLLQNPDALEYWLQLKKTKRQP